MRNPLRKRYAREIKNDLGKYLVIFLFFSVLVGLISGFLSDGSSIEATFYENFDTYNVEDGHITFNKPLTEEVRKELEEKGNITLFDMEYVEEDIDENGTTLRIYKDRKEVNKTCMYSGTLPASEQEIAIDRLFAENNNLSIGDTITLNSKEYVISGFVALVDYGCMFENESDMMLNAIHFGVAIMTEEGYETLNSTHVSYCYAWKFHEKTDNKQEARQKSEELIEALEDVIKTYDTAIIQAEVDAVYDKDKLLSVNNYVLRVDSKAVNYCMDDMSSDRPMFIIFYVILVVLLAFIFAVITSNTIASEASVIGTLRASGYTKAEMIRHYMFLPMATTVLSAIVGNLVGYTAFAKFYLGVYYNSFCLAPFQTRLNTEAFLITTVVPLIVMFIINFLMLSGKLKLSPMKFLRHDLAKKKRRRAILLNKKIPFLTRFRIRILFQNLSAYFTLFAGIFIGGVLLIFGIMFEPLLADYADLITENRICDYQYVLKQQVETNSADAEKYCLTTMDSDYEGYLTDEIGLYGIEEDSKYVHAEIPEGMVLISNGMADKFGLENGDILTLKDSVSGKKKQFTIGGEYQYEASLCVFMSRSLYLESFHEKEDYFTGYFTNTELTDIDSDDIVTIITQSDLRKVSDQMIKSMGGMMSIFLYFGILIFLLLMYIMTKQILEKNTQSIAMTKILGFRSSEIAGLYLVITSIVVAVSLLICVPLIDELLRVVFEKYMYTEITGYLPYIVSKMCYVKMFVLGIGSYAFVSACMMRKINKIEKSEALKNVE